MPKLRNLLDATRLGGYYDLVTLLCWSAHSENTKDNQKYAEQS